MHGTIRNWTAGQDIGTHHLQYWPSPGKDSHALHPPLCRRRLSERRGRTGRSARLATTLATVVAGLASSSCLAAAEPDKSPFEISDLRLTVGIVPQTRDVQSDVDQPQTGINEQNDVGAMGLGVRVELSITESFGALGPYGGFFCAVGVMDSQQSTDANNPNARLGLTGPVKIDAMGADAFLG